jgi:sialidase-1
VTVLPAHFLSSARLRAAAAIGLATAVIAASGVAVAPQRAEAATARLCASTPFRSSAARHTWYRIPAIVETNAGTLLAFAEKRDSKEPSSDTGDTDVVLARSTNGGCSWSAPRTVAARGTDTVGNPAPVVDRATGTVLLLTVDRAKGGPSLHGLHLQRSTDDGRSFTAYDRSGNDLYGLPGWSGGLTGPGHALQLTAGPRAGRIIVPVGYQRDGERGAYGIISDDHGATWHVGYDSRGDDHRQEGTVAQLADGRVWISYHEQSPSVPVGTGRIAALSSDGGDSLSTPFARLALPTVSVQASSLVLTGSHAGTVLLSSPGGKDPRTRRVMTIFTSQTAVPGSRWIRHPVTLDDTPASYSDLVQIDDATVGVLYETGTSSWHERIGFRSLRISALTAGATVRPRTTVTVPKVARSGRTLVVPVKVTAAGTASPAGSVKVVLTKPHFRKTLVLALKYPGRGLRLAFFPKVAKGKYLVTATYSGTPRIAAQTVKKTVRVR